MMIGERTNVTGSKKFARLIKSEQLRRSRSKSPAQQVDGGANVIDVNMDEALLDGEAAMTKFLRLIAGEHDIAAAPDDDRQLASGRSSKRASRCCKASRSSTRSA